MLRAGVRAASVACAAAVALSGCTLGAKFPDFGPSPSPRVASGYDIPRGGGAYKVGQPYKIAGRRYVPAENPQYDKSGVASWYGEAFHGRKTANGEIYNMRALTAGHPTLPLPSYVYVTNLDNGRTLLVRVNDRGPYVDDRLIDLSYGTAQALGFHRKGLARVRVRYAGRAPLDGNDIAERRFAARQPWMKGRALAATDASPITTASLAQGNDDSSQTPPSWSVFSYRNSLNAGAGAERGATAAADAKDAGDTFVIVGPFAERAEAERVRYMLAGGEPSSLVASPSDSAEYQVRLGPYAEGAASAAMARVASSGFNPLPTPAE
jgi:rare lipoprotein A